MKPAAFELSVTDQAVAWLIIGAALGAVIRHPFTAARLGRLIEGAGTAALFGFAFLLGSERLDQGPSSPYSVVAATSGVLLYLAFLNAFGKLRRGRVRRPGSA